MAKRIERRLTEEERKRHAELRAAAMRKFPPKDPKSAAPGMPAKKKQAP